MAAKACGFTFPSANEALANRKGESEKKRNRSLPDTIHVDRVTMGQSTPLGLAEPSLRKTSTKKFRLGQEEDVVTLTLPADASVYSDTSFFDSVDDSLLLLMNHKRLTNIGTV